MLQVPFVLLLLQVDKEVDKDTVILQLALTGRMHAHNLAVLDGIRQIRLHQSLLKTSASSRGQASVLGGNFIPQGVIVMQHCIVDAFKNQLELISVRFYKERIK